MFEDGAQAGHAPVPQAGEEVGGVSCVATFFLLPVLKSVSYQPLPLKRKAGAETFLDREASWQVGHSVKGSADIF